MNQVLVVADSPILRIVVARTLERIYLKPIPVRPDVAVTTLASRRPSTVIFDAATDDEFLDPLLAELSHLRRGSQEVLPRVLMIEEPDQEDLKPGFAGLVDARIAKPITPDTLQPVIERLIGR